MGKVRTTQRKPTKTVSAGPLRKPINGMALGPNPGVVPGMIVLKKGHGNIPIAPGIRRRLVITSGCSNKGWIRFYLENKDFLTRLFGIKDSFYWMTKSNFEKAMIKKALIDNKENLRKIDI
jgi:hypothetical protein